MDERPARRLGGALGIPLMGTLDLLLQAKSLGFISELKPQLDASLKYDFRVAPALYEQVLKSAGELS